MFLVFSSFSQLSTHSTLKGVCMQAGLVWFSSWKGVCCCDVAVAQINYPSFKHNTQDSIKQARGRSHEEGLVQSFMLYDMQFEGVWKLSRLKEKKTENRKLSSKILIVGCVTIWSRGSHQYPSNHSLKFDLIQSWFDLIVPCLVFCSRNQ